MERNFWEHQNQLKTKKIKLHLELFCNPFLLMSRMRLFLRGEEFVTPQNPILGLINVLSQLVAKAYMSVYKP